MHWSLPCGPLCPHPLLWHSATATGIQEASASCISLCTSVAASRCQQQSSQQATQLFLPCITWQCSFCRRSDQSLTCWPTTGLCRRVAALCWLQPSAFNMFVKERMAELKAAGVHAEGDERNPLFTLAAQQWKQLPEGERQERVAKHKVGGA